MTEVEVKKLLRKACKAISKEEAYTAVLERVDIQAIKEASDSGNLSAKEIASSFAYMGVLYGIEYALRNLKYHF